MQLIEKNYCHGVGLDECTKQCSRDYMDVPEDYLSTVLAV